MAVCGNRVGLLVIDNAVGKQDASAIIDLDLAARGYNAAVDVVDDFVCLQQNILTRARKQGLRALRRRCQQGCEAGERSPPKAHPSS